MSVGGEGERQGTKPGAGTRVEPAARRRKRGRTAMFVSLGCGGLGAIVCLVGIITSVMGFDAGRQEAEATVVRFVEQMAAGEVAAAHASGTEGFRSSSVEDMRRLAEAANLSSYERTEFTGWHFNKAFVGESSATLTGTLHLSTGDTVGIRATVQEAGDGWRMHGFHLNIPLDL